MKRSVFVGEIFQAGNKFIEDIQILPASIVLPVAPRLVSLSIDGQPAIVFYSPDSSQILRVEIGKTVTDITVFATSGVNVCNLIVRYREPLRGEE